ncbi:MAG TPA: FRG domain-containing protein [Bacteroidales bacterium]|nr:FRG domain-containing protein [Bacteroidales bacterium]
MEINNITELISWNIEPKNTDPIDGNRFVFRGMSNKCFELIPKISRTNDNSSKNTTLCESSSDKQIDPDTINDRIEKLRQYLNLRLPAYGYDLHDVNQQNKEWRELFIAQHYGVPTNLLDFTRNPLTALFFACEDLKIEEDGVLYAVSIKAQDVEPAEFDYNKSDYNIAAYNLLSNSKNKKSPYDLGKHVFVVPPEFDKRIKSQNSVFCCFPKDQLNIPLEEFFSDNATINKNDSNAIFRIVKWTIPYTNKNSILNELNKIGINHSTIFPDMFGLGKFLSWKLLK